MKCKKKGKTWQQIPRNHTIARTKFSFSKKIQNFQRKNDKEKQKKKKKNTRKWENHKKYTIKMRKKTQNAIKKALKIHKKKIHRKCETMRCGSPLLN